MDGDAACTQCHQQAQFTRDLSRHTFHAAGSTGSRCLNCHMPHTTYALLGAIRSHQIESPTLAGSVRHGVPNACNLCHLDKTLAWTQEHLSRRYGQPALPLSEEQQTVSAALLWTLKGHAAQRAIAAWHAGWAPAQEASGADWLTPFLARLLADPYGVVRYVAHYSLRTLPGVEVGHYDFLAPEPELRRHATNVLSRWKTGRPPPTRTDPALLLRADGQIMEDRVEALLRQRDNRPTAISE
jgi:hypothetical protein